MRIISPVGNVSAHRVGSHVTISVLHERLESARGQLEERFLEGGAVLVTVLETLTKVVDLLERVGGSLNDDDAGQAQTKLNQTAELLRALPQTHSERRTRLACVKELSGAFVQNIDSMKEALRYLRTFAMTAKIAGANVADFAGFVAEIMERIQFATEEVKLLADRVNALKHQIDAVSLDAGGPLESHFDALPEIVAKLSRNGQEIEAQRLSLSQIAAKVADMARKAQGKLSQVLSAMQIGDITRQRIEHCQEAFAIANDYLSSDEAAGLASGERSDIQAAVTRLVANLLAEATTEFKRDSGRVVETIRSLSGDVASLMKLYEGMISAQPAGRENAIGVLHGDLVTVRGMVAEISQAARAATELSQNTAGLVGDLTASVETIQLVRRDIQYMALNTTLRCGRLGEEGRAINVVTGELRNFASVLDGDAEQILRNLRQLQQEAAGLAGGEPGATASTPVDLEAFIDGVIPLLASASATMDENMQALRLTGEDMAAKALGAVGRLDFNSGIGEILAACVTEASAADDHGHRPFTETVGFKTVGERISRTYTMVAERAIHAGVFGESASPAVAAASSDDDLLEDALF